MQIWQIGLVLLAVVWALQALGTWIQMSHYRKVMGEIARRWSDGHLGAGNARSSLGKGVVLILVTEPDSTIRKVMVMEGRSVFARFVDLPGFEGRSLRSTRDEGAFPAKMKGRNTAFEQAAVQIDRAIARLSGPPAGALAVQS